MSNIAIIADFADQTDGMLTIDRTTSRKTKTGVKTAIKTRSLLGALSSGTKDERIAFCKAQALQLWEKHQYQPLINEFIRVFAISETAIAKCNEKTAKALEARPDCGRFLLNVGKPSKKMCAAFMTMAMNRIDADLASGEKAIYCEIAQEINDYESALQARLTA